jgi:hypothetical protein
MKLFAVDPDLGDGISTYMNVVVVQGAPDDVTREDYFEAISAEVEGADVTDLREERIELPAGEALQLTFEHSQSGVEKPLAVLQYVLFANRTGYTLTYTTSADALESRLDEFERSARSFRVAGS